MTILRIPIRINVFKSIIPLIIWGDMSLKLNHSVDYYKVLSNIIENESTISTTSNDALWVAMGNELEIEGVDKTQISTLVRKDIEDMMYEEFFKDECVREDYKWRNRTFYKVMGNNDWINPYMVRHIVDAPMHQENSSINTQNNGKMLLLYDKIIDVVRTMRDKSKEIKPLEDTFGKKEMKEFYKQRNTIIDNCKNAIDNKTKVPKNTELFLLEHLATILGSVNKCAQVFMEYNLMQLKEQGKFFTLKQATKFQKGGKQSQLEILIPKSRDPAIFLNCSGVQCTCGSWNVKEQDNSNMLECYDCMKVLPKGHISKCEHCQIPLYKERLQYMVKHNNTCENCDTKNDLPLELVELAKS